MWVAPADRSVHRVFSHFDAVLVGDGDDWIGEKVVMRRATVYKPCGRKARGVGGEPDSQCPRLVEWGHWRGISRWSCRVAGMAGGVGCVVADSDLVRLRSRRGLYLFGAVVLAGRSAVTVGWWLDIWLEMRQTVAGGRGWPGRRPSSSSMRAATRCVRCPAVALLGLRRGEAAGLRWCDLDLDAGVVQLLHHCRTEAAALLCARRRPRRAPARLRWIRPW